VLAELVMPHARFQRSYVAAAEEILASSDDNHYAGLTVGRDIDIWVSTRLAASDRAHGRIARCSAGCGLCEFSLNARIHLPVSLRHYICMRDKQQGDSTWQRE
jgi:acetone carboxylase gamma subunit